MKLLYMTIVAATTACGPGAIPPNTPAQPPEVMDSLAVAVASTVGLSDFTVAAEITPKVQGASVRLTRLLALATDRYGDRAAASVVSGVAPADLPLRGEGPTIWVTDGTVLRVTGHSLSVRLVVNVGFQAVYTDRDGETHQGEEQPYRFCLRD